MSSAKQTVKMDVQKLVNELATFPQYRQYVEQHKLSLIDSRLSEIDALLDSGEITVPKEVA